MPQNWSEKLLHLFFGCAILSSVSRTTRKDTPMKVRIARIIEKDENTDIATGKVWDNMADNAAYDCACVLYRRALQAGLDLSYTVEFYEVEIKSSAASVRKLSNSLNYTV